MAPHFQKNSTSQIFLDCLWLYVNILVGFGKSEAHPNNYMMMQACLSHSAIDPKSFSMHGATLSDISTCQIFLDCIFNSIFVSLSVDIFVNFDKSGAHPNNNMVMGKAGLSNSKQCHISLFNLSHSAIDPKSSMQGYTFRHQHACRTFLNCIFNIKTALPSHYLWVLWSSCTNQQQIQIRVWW